MAHARSATRTRTRKRAGGFALAGAAATVVALCLSVAPASAAVTTTVQFSFPDASNVQHTCSIQLVREYPYRTDNQVGRGATTMVQNGDPYCVDGVAYISATYKDPDGETATPVENSDGTSTARRYAPVGSDFTTIHSVQYFSCNGDDSVCRFTTSRSK